MKYIAVLLIVLVFSCDNSVNAFNSLAGGIVGQWQLEATKVSPGGTVDWSLASQRNIYTFKSDGTFTFKNIKNDYYDTSGTYFVEDNELFLNYARDRKEVNAVFYMQFKRSKLILEFIGCIEECKARYKRIK